MDSPQRAHRPPPPIAAAVTADAPNAGGAHERTPAEARSRYRELLEELRTVIPGAQVLLAFLLAVPFSANFDRLDDVGRDVFAGSLLGTALATILFMTPAAYHRVARRNDRSLRLHLAIRATIAGMTLLSLSVAGVLFVVVRDVFGSTVTGAVFGLTALIASLVLWYALPALRRD